MAEPPPPTTAEGDPRRILILAGEASGDAHGSHVARALNARWPETELVGLGGQEMARAGVELLRELDDLAVMGFAEVVARLPFFRKLEGELTALIDSGSVDLVLPIDYPGLNLRIARHAHRAGVPVVYYIGPQVWAWKAHRARALAEAADRIAVILPLEVPIYEAEGGHVEFVGHPLLDEQPPPAPPDFIPSLGLDPGRPILALFPGSRRQELDRHLPEFTAAAREVARRRPEVQAAIGRAPSLPAELFEGAGLPVTTDGASLRDVATAGLVKSGTSTLEAALAGMPFVMAYRTHPLTWLLAKRLVRVPHVALANLVAGEGVVEEFLQGQVQAGPLADALLPLLDPGDPKRARVLRGLERVRGALGRGGAAVRVAELAAEVWAERTPAAEGA